jgi:hypothetical protein
MRRIEKMMTLNVRRAAMVAAALPVTSAPVVRPAARPDQAATVGAALERQIDEIQHTFGVRWEW